MAKTRELTYELEDEARESHDRKAAERAGKTTVVNLRRDPFDVYIGRAGKGQDGYFGNPFKLEEHGLKALDLYREHFEHRISTDEEFRRRVLELKGKALGCFCKPGPCHGDIIAEFVNFVNEPTNV